MNQGNEMSDFDKNDPLWKVLGEAKTAEASPWFVDRVLNNLPDASEPAAARGGWAWFLRWAPGLTMTAVVCATLAAMQFRDDHSPAAFQAAIEFEIIQNLDRYIVEADANAWKQ